MPGLTRASIPFRKNPFSRRGWTRDVILFDDVTTKGGSVMQAVRAVRGATVKKTITIVDWLECDAENLRKGGIELGGRRACADISPKLLRGRELPAVSSCHPRGRPEGPSSLQSFTKGRRPQRDQTLEIPSAQLQHISARTSS
jgi:hypothetical protein